MDILKCHAIQSIAVGVDNASYLEVVGDRKRFPNKHGSQYELCGFRTATMVGQWAEKHSPFPISFVFDQGNRYRHQLERGFEVVRRGPHSFTPYLGPITFASDERVAPLQAADLMAWTVGRTMYDEHVEHRNKPTAPWAARLWNLMPCMEGYFHRDLLISLRDEARYWHQENVRIDDRQTQKFLRAVKPASELLRRKD